MSDLDRYLDDLNERYLELHVAKETAFWDTKMGIADRGREYADADLALKDFLADAAGLTELRRRRRALADDDPHRVTLDGWILTFERNQVEDEDARAILREIAEREADLHGARRSMELGYVTEDGVEPASSVALGNTVRTDPDPVRRRAAYEGLRSIETFALENGFLEIVKLRNRFARKLGFPDFYDYKANWAEGFGKDTVFEFLDGLERGTRGACRRGLEGLQVRAGDEALLPWNASFHTSGGDLQRRRDEYFPFHEAVERWARSFGALGIRFRQARVTLDLLDRKGKYENGFMHGPVPAFHRRGKWQPAEIGFTANALPGSPGAGYRATQTLFHEGGHAAHYSNIAMDAPCFSQEYAPSSVALAETQAMFCDRILSDPDWQTLYARNAAGTPLPFELMEESIRETQPHAAYAIRNLMTVCYAEKTLYEIPEQDLSAENVLRGFREAESRLTLLPEGCPRPTLSVPHLLARESSGYYHGYVLAQMAVFQTREHFRAKHGRIVDNPDIGAALGRTYWEPGNSRGFLELVEELTGQPLSAEALVAEVSRDVEEAKERTRETVRRAEKMVPSPDPPDLDIRLRVIHGAETVVEETTDPLQAAAAFRTWLRERRPRTAAASS